MKKRNKWTIELQKRLNYRLRTQYQTVYNSTKNTSSLCCYHSSMPSNVSLQSKKTRSTVINIIKSMATHAKQGKCYYLDLQKVNILHPDGTIYFLHHLDKYKDLDITGRQSQSSTVRAMLSKLKVHQRMGLRESVKQDLMIDRWHIFTGDKAEFDENYLAVESLLKEVLGDSELFYTLNEAISEAVTNAVSHGYSNDAKYKKWILFLSISQNICSVIISDLGVTIPKSSPIKLAEKMVQAISFWSDKGDAERIKIATTWRRTSTNESYRGKGFDNILAVCEQQKDASIHVLSRKGGWSSDNTMTSYADAIKGTIIAWNIPLSSLVKQKGLAA